MNIQYITQLNNALTDSCHSDFLDCLDKVCFNLVGHKLLTFMTIEGSAQSNPEQTVCRIYTTDQKNYPSGGYKPLPENEWSKKVLVNKEVFLASNIEEISAVFFDHELIETLGLGSTINIPVISFGQVIGTVNLLHKTNFYNEDSIEKLQWLMPWFVIALTYPFSEKKHIGEQC